MFNNVSIIGDGAMGSVLAMLLCEKQIATRMWGYDPEQLAQIEKLKENSKFLPGYKLPENLKFEADDKLIIKDADLIVSAVPCQYIRQVWSRLKDYVPSGITIVSVAKGIENETLLLPNQILSEVTGKNLECVALSGPTIADELARKLPAVATAACENEVLAQKVQHTFNTSWLRVYTNPDIIGVELAGALKNVIAIAAGIIDGARLGDNAKAALLSRGLAEISRLGIACGANAQTFSGLTGLGDLVTTCFSPKGRNRSFGERIGKGQNVEDAKSATVSVIEGVATCKSVVDMAKQHSIEMPITQAVYEILFEKKSVQAAISDLMMRELKSE